MSIKLSGIEFEGSKPLIGWEAPNRAGIYAIFMRPQPQNDPNTYRVTYIGETGDFSDRGFPRSHHKFSCWKSAAGSEANIYVAIYLMPGSTEKDRMDLEQQLITAYKPSCND